MTLSRAVITSWVLLASSTATLAAERVAVLELTASPTGLVDEMVLSSITDEARRAAVDVLPTSRYSVITRENQETVLRENGIDAAKLCEAECEVDLARTIGATLLVTGNVSKIGSKMSLHMKLFHAERGQVLKIVRVSAKSEEELYDLAYDEGVKLFKDGLGLDPSTTVAAPVTASADFVLVTLNAPVKDALSVGELRVLPGGQVSLAPGRHRIDVPEGPCTDARSVEIDVAVGGAQSFSLDVPAKQTQIFVDALFGETRVEGALVRVDGRDVGTADHVLTVPLCARQVSVSTIALGETTQSIALTPGVVNTVRVALRDANAIPDPDTPPSGEGGDVTTASTTTDDGGGDTTCCWTACGCCSLLGVAPPLAYLFYLLTASSSSSS